METRLATVWATLLVATAFAACGESTTTPVRSASFAVAGDTGDTGGGGAPQSHFVANGDFGSVSWFSSDSAGGGGGAFTFGFLNVDRGGETNDPRTFLFYFVQQCDALSNCTFFSGSGLIPSNDLRASGTTLHLSTNTSGNPDFTTFEGPAGLVSADWERNGFFQQRTSGTSEMSFPGFRQQANGVASFESANAAGSVVGLAISANNNGGIGTNHNVTIDIFR